jgi:cyclopropane fatty-acyl-phospholipid synthase-like methyltransferase
MKEDRGVVQNELEYHEKLYSGFAQSHFARPAVRALRRHMVDRIVRVAGLHADSRVLSFGCGIGDTELLLAERVKEVIGVDLSPIAIRSANLEARKLGIKNARFLESDIPVATEGAFDAVIAIFTLHHLPEQSLAALPAQVFELLNPGGILYSLDPSKRRLSGAVGRLLIPGLMKKYQSPDERELVPEDTAELFRRVGYQTRCRMYDFASSPLAGLFPGWRLGYRIARAADNLILLLPLLKHLGSNFEIVAKRP